MVGSGPAVIALVVKRRIKMPVKQIPDGYHVVPPILLVQDADRLVDFMKGTFDAQEHQLGRRPDGKIWHADLMIAGAHIMIGAAREPFEAAAAAVNVYVPDVDATYRRALETGATSITAPSDRFYGDRNAVVKDRTGIVWSIATHIEDVAAAELTRREAEALRRSGR
jgi:PhnB protein